MSFVFEIFWPAEKFFLINITYFFNFGTNFDSHFLKFSFKQSSSFGKLDQLFISFKMIYNMTIFENKSFFELPKVKGQFLPIPMKTPAYDNVYPRFSDSY